ncbi:MAG: hypothetical protein AAGG81_05590 [Chlamydiota bacterium]
MREEIVLLSNEMITFDKLEIPEYKFNWLEDKHYSVNISASKGRSQQAEKERWKHSKNI